MEQTSLQVTPTRSIYTFQAAQVTLTVTFFTPAFPHDLDALSRPVTYLSFTAIEHGPARRHAAGRCRSCHRRQHSR